MLRTYCLCFIRPEINCWDFVIKVLWDSGCIWYLRCFYSAAKFMKNWIMQTLNMSILSVKIQTLIYHVVEVYPLDQTFVDKIRNI